MKEKYIEIFKKQGLNFAKCLGSKSGYRDSNPDHLVIFNARIYLKSYFKNQKDKDVRGFFKGQENEIWYGDIDFNKDIYKLYKAQREIRESIIVTSEMGNKIVEIGDSPDKVWLGSIGMGKETKGITLEDFEKGIK